MSRFPEANPPSFVVPQNENIGGKHHLLVTEYQNQLFNGYHVNGFAFKQSFRQTANSAAAVPCR